MLAPREAEACPNVTVPMFNAHVQKTKNAQAALDRGDIATAKKTIQPVLELSHAQGISGREGTKDWRELEPVFRRAVRIHALATFRDSKSTDSERTEALRIFEKAVLPRSTSTDHEGGVNTDPTVLADHAEMLSRVPARSGPSLMVLRTLRDKDLLGSAHAFAALARLEKGAGNADAEKDARERCQKAAVKKSICEE